MPVDNRFRHQEYDQHPSSGHWRILETPPMPPAPGSDEYQSQVTTAGQALCRHGISSIYLVHGTLAGTDLTGLHSDIERFAPGFGRRIGGTWKQLVDMFAGDMGNYTQPFADRLQKAVGKKSADCAGGGIAVQRFLWTSENHHLGRADAAVRLIVELSKRTETGNRVMLWGHSHAGNVFAILTNLLGGNTETRERFFEATAALVEQDEDWGRAMELLSSTSLPRALNPAQLDIVTFGTPIRYGWERRGYGRLLHVVNHRALEGVEVPKVPFPPTAAQLASAAAGDYFQQIFIAGTNFPPSIYSLKKWKTEGKLHLLLQSNVASRRIWEALCQGRRVAADGLTMLVDYVASGDGHAASLGGHAVYTRSTWLPFHLALVNQWLSETPKSGL